MENSLLDPIRAALRSQYQAALDMFEQTLERCPESLWEAAPAPAPGAQEPGGTNRFWRVAFHALFYLHLYLQPEEASFTSWSKQRDQSQFLGPLPWPPHDQPQVGEPYTPGELHEYIAFCRAEIDRQVAALALDAPSGFDWLPFNKLELQIYNIRHLQQHTGELSAFLMNRENILVDWIGARREHD